MDDINKQKVDFLTAELDKMGKILSGLSESIGIQLAIAGLLSFLPSSETPDGYLSQFFLWTFPFIIVAISLYYRASWRVTSVVKGKLFATTGSPDWSKFLGSQVEYLETVWKMSLDNHDKVISIYSWTRSVIYAYIFSTITNFYIFMFYGRPDVCVSVIVFLASIVIVVLLYQWPKSKSEKGRAIGIAK